MNACLSNIGRATRAFSNAATRARRGRPLAALALVLQLAFCNVALADKVYCENTSAGLLDALNKARTSDETTSIKLEPGFYQLGAFGAYLKSPLIVSGDYVPGSKCTQRGNSGNATVIDFGGSANNVQLIQQKASPSALIKFERVTLQHGGFFDMETGKLADPPFLGQGNYPGFITLSHVHFTGFSGGVQMQTDNGGLTMIDALFDRISGGGCPIYYDPLSDNNVLLDHVTMDIGSGADFCLNDTNEGDEYYEIDNSIFWASDGTTSTVHALDNNSNTQFNHVTLNNSLLIGFAGKTGSFANNSPVTTDPKWIAPASGNYHLALGASPAINAGTTQVSGNEPASDLDGNTRVIGSAPDIGAYESASNNATTFTVTNTNNDGPGSLRQAMTQANASNAVVTSVLFNILDASKQPVCPAVINLASALPDITVPMQIEGYSQPGSYANSDAEAFLANLCVVVQPDSGFGLGSGFHVPASAASASLTLTGIGVGSFYRGVSLQGGNGHRILGNQFGGLINQGSYQLSGANGLPGSNNAAIYVDLDAAPAGVQIGGDDPSYRNAIQSVHNNGIGASAIVIASSVHGAGTSCQIAGNLIGPIDDGTDTAGNDYGLMLDGNFCVVHANRFAGNFFDAIWINGGSGNKIRNNTIGLLPYGFNLAAVNGGVGVRVGGYDNEIGGSSSFGSPLAYANVIEFMEGPGVVVAAGDGNSVRGNTIVYNNNGVNGGDVDIDIGDNGPSANDLHDLDGGANWGVNFPTLHWTSWSATPQPGQPAAMTLSGVLSAADGSGYYRIDVYATDDCHPVSGRGSAQTYIGGIDFAYLGFGTSSTTFSVPVTIPAFQPTGSYVSVMATNATLGYGSSELSTCFNTDTVFRDELEGF
jgi:hypothetical protein